MQDKTGLCDKDLAIDYIADLFKEKNGYYYQFNHFFYKDRINLKSTNPDILKSKLLSLVCALVNQRITESREDFGESYFKVKKAIDIALDRNKGEFIRCIFRNEFYIHNSFSEKVNFKKLYIPNETLLFELHGCEFKTRSIPEVIRKCLNMVENQKFYCKAIEYSKLTQCISEYYKQRLSEYVRNH